MTHRDAEGQRVGRPRGSFGWLARSGAIRARAVVCRERQIDICRLYEVVDEGREFGIRNGIAAAFGIGFPVISVRIRSARPAHRDRKSTRLNSSHLGISY